ncbi:hypothetical protein DFS33DRAFT_1278749 [Desarmillaria ectypa]|nr:hypothetical protein DFS33DRAFT_1278749 [Desarmillaria ectypa]
MPVLIAQEAVAPDSLEIQNWYLLFECISKPTKSPSILGSRAHRYKSDTAERVRGTFGSKKRQKWAISSDWRSWAIAYERPSGVESTIPASSSDRRWWKAVHEISSCRSHTDTNNVEVVGSLLIRCKREGPTSNYDVLQQLGGLSAAWVFSITPDRTSVPAQIGPQAHMIRCDIAEADEDTEIQSEVNVQESWPNKALMSQNRRQYKVLHKSEDSVASERKKNTYYRDKKTKSFAPPESNYSDISVVHSIEQNDVEICNLREIPLYSSLKGLLNRLNVEK